MIVSYAVILVAALVRGGEGKPSILGIRPCTGESWVTLLAAQFLCLFIAVTAYRLNKKTLDEQDVVSGSYKTAVVMSKFLHLKFSNFKEFIILY